MHVSRMTFTILKFVIISICQQQSFLVKSSIEGSGPKWDWDSRFRKRILGLFFSKLVVVSSRAIFGISVLL